MTQTALYIDVKRTEDPRRESKYAHFNAFFVSVENGITVTNYTWDHHASKAKSMYFENLQAWSQMDGYQNAQSPTTGTQPYAWTLGFRSVYVVNEYSAPLMIRTLTTIKKRMSAMDKTLGEASTFSEWLIRFANACGIKLFVIRTDKRNTCMFSERTHLFETDKAQVRHIVDQMARDVIKELEGKSEGETA